MIPRHAILDWQKVTPWPSYSQIEQDLLLSRALIELYSNDIIVNHLAFRGGTALHKLYIRNPVRYSEDLDFVQIKPGPIGPIIDAIRSTLGDLFPQSKWKQSEGRVTLVYKYEAEIPPPETMKIKVEINTREHFSVLGTQSVPFEVKSPWFTGSAQISTYKLEELLATKLRALYQRRKGRDLFDVFYALQYNEHLQIQHIIQCFHQYLENEGLRVTSKMFEENMRIKINDPLFRGDMKNLLISDYHYDIDEAYQMITEKIIKHL